MSEPFNEVDKLLLSENIKVVKPEEAGKVQHQEAKVKHEPIDHSDGIDFTPLSANAGTLVKVDSKGNEIEEENTMTANDESTKTSPKKRGAAIANNTDGESAPPAKKRSPTKKTATTEPVTPKKRASPKKKALEIISDPEEDPAETNTTDSIEPHTPSPKKGRTPAKAKNAKGKTEIKIETEDGDETVDEMDNDSSPTKSPAKEAITARNTPRKRSAPKGAVAAARCIPSSWDNADNADKMLVSMKEEGKDWATIRTAWKEATGQETGNSTLPNRYNRIKVNMMHLKDGDAERLLSAKDEVERIYESEKWAKIAATMEQNGGDKYPTAFLQKMVKQLEIDGGAAGASNTDGGEDAGEDVGN